MPLEIPRPKNRDVRSRTNQLFRPCENAPNTHKGWKVEKVYLHFACMDMESCESPTSTCGREQKQHKNVPQASKTSKIVPISRKYSFSTNRKWTGGLTWDCNTSTPGIPVKTFFNPFKFLFRAVECRKVRATKMQKQRKIVVYLQHSKISQLASKTSKLVSRTCSFRRRKK